MNKTETVKLLDMINGGRIEEIKTLLENNLKELRMKELHGNGFLKASKQIKKMLDKAGKTRPILGYYDIQDGKQVCTDSHFLFIMNEGYYLENLEHHGGNHGTYPDIREFTPVENGDCLVDIDMDQLANPKTMPMGGKNVAIYKIESKYTKATIQAQFLENAIHILGLEDLKMYVYNPNRPVLLTSPKGKAIIVPILVND